MPNPDRIVLFIQIMRPLYLVGGVFVYALGVGIARYLGVSIDWGLYLLGQAWVTLIQLSALFLDAYFNEAPDHLGGDRGPHYGDHGAPGASILPRQVVLVGATACLAVAASLTVLMLQQTRLTPVTLLIMVLILLETIFYAVPPIRLSQSGYGEMASSILMANFIPALAFLLQAGELHRLIAMSTFPLTALYLAMLLAFELPDYARDVKFERRTLLVRVGWQRGMYLHNLLILSGFLLLVLALTLGLPLAIGLPAFAPFLLGLLQIWQMRRIADGARPNWFALTLNAMMVFGLVAYLLAFSFWTR